LKYLCIGKKGNKHPVLAAVFDLDFYFGKTLVQAENFSRIIITDCPVTLTTPTGHFIKNN